MNGRNVPGLKLLLLESWDTATLCHAHPPRFYHPNKRLLHEIAYGPGEQDAGTLAVSRWASVGSAPVAWGSGMRVREQSGFFDYRVASASEWHMNFADPNLFFGYGGRLFAQDEIQVAEHPALASVREKLSRLAQRSTAHAPATRDPSGAPTPVLVQGAERRIAVANAADEAAGSFHSLYGRRFGMASCEAIRRAVRKLEPSASNILAIAAPTPGHGVYRVDAICDALRSAWCGFRAAAQLGGPGTAVRIHTGNWGCGAFGGNLELMYLVQLLAGEWAGVGEQVFHAPEAAPFAAARTKFAELLARNGDYDRVLAYLLAQRYEWGVSDGN